MAMNLEGKKVVVVGLAQTGVATAKFCVRHGAQVTVTDAKPAEKLAEQLAQLAGLPVRQELGGHDVASKPDEVRKLIGLTGQSAAVDELLTGRENLLMMGRLYRLTKRSAKERAEELLQQFDLVDAADRPLRSRRADAVRSARGRASAAEPPRSPAP